MTPPNRKRFLAPEVLETAARAISSEAKSQDIKVALLGGFAMQYYGSPRLTGDVDFVSSDRLSGSDILKRVKRLSVGGDRFLAIGEVPSDVVFREDEYALLYEEALASSADTGMGFRVVTPEYLAAMKMAARRAKDELDLLWLLSQPGLVDINKARSIVHKHVGGRFGVDEFNSVLREAEWRRGEFVEEEEGSEEE